ncbi:MAG: AraC family transcriptional regulator, partial [Pseudomonadota bacterium]
DSEVASHFKPSEITASRKVEKPSAFEFFDCGPLKFVYCVNEFGVEIDCPGVDDIAILHIPFTGAISAQMNTGRSTIRRGSLFLTHPGKRVALSILQKTRLLAVQIPKTCLSSDLFGSDVQAHVPASHLVAPETHEITPLLRSLSFIYQDVSQTGSLENAEALSHAMTPIIAQRLVKPFKPLNAADFEDNRDRQIIRNCRTLLEVWDADQPISIADMANYNGISMRTLQRVFLKVEGYAPRTWPMNEKLAKAHRALLSGDTNVTQAALAAGFNDLGRFSKFYGQRYGEQPSLTLRRTLQRQSIDKLA